MTPKHAKCSLCPAASDTDAYLSRLSVQRLVHDLEEVLLQHRMVGLVPGDIEHLKGFASE